jgi:SAM-dependent methyltransferase
VLLVGCSDGSLGAQLKARQQVFIEGIDPNVSLAELARSRLDRVVVGEPSGSQGPLTPRRGERDTGEGMDSFSEGSFDCVVCEAFDRFRHPEHLLSQVRRWLKPDGRFVAVTANVRHHGIVEALIEDRWPNGDGASHGPAYRRPLRFYTRREIEKLLFRAGFHVVDLRPLPGSGFSEWEARGRPDEVRVGPLHIAGLSHGEAEEYYAAGFLITATPETPPDYGVTSIVIITHNQLEYTRQCVDSIRERTDEPYELIFVDNASTDGTVEYLRALED